MEAKRTPRTPRTGERKSANMELLREMISVSNNSRMTTEMATKLTNSLDKDELRETIEWLRHANRQISNKLAQGKRF